MREMLRAEVHFAVETSFNQDDLLNGRLDPDETSI